MFCTNCGEKIENGDKFCIKCGTPVVHTEELQNLVQQSNKTVINNNISENSMSEEDKKNANILCIISLICTYGSGLFPLLTTLNNSESESMFSSVFSMGPLIGLVLMIIARIKYPKSTFAKILMWVYIVNIIILIIGMIVLMIACYSMIQSCKGMG